MLVPGSNELIVATDMQPKVAPNADRLPKERSTAPPAIAFREKRLRASLSSCPTVDSMPAASLMLFALTFEATTPLSALLSVLLSVKLSNLTPVPLLTSFTSGSMHCNRTYYESRVISVADNATVTPPQSLEYWLIWRL